MGLLINRKLFQQAGLDPDTPPTTWEEVRAAAKKIAALGNGIAGFGEYSAGNTGGWHFTAQMYGLGGDIVGRRAARRPPSTTRTGKQVVENLKAMRWEDDSMGKTQLLKWGDLQKQIATRQARHVPRRARRHRVHGPATRRQVRELRHGPDPRRAKATLFGGNNYMIKKGISPDKIKAAVAWLELQEPHGRQGAVRLGPQPRPTVCPSVCRSPTSSPARQQDEGRRSRAANATMPVENFKPFMDNPVPGKAEPPKAQEIYKVLDNVMSGVLTNKNADVDKLLATAEHAGQPDPGEPVAAPGDRRPAPAPARPTRTAPAPRRLATRRRAPHEPASSRRRPAP